MTNIRLSKQHIIGALTFLVGLCGLVAAAAGPLELGVRGLAIVGIISGSAALAIRLVSNQAIDSAEREPSPQQAVTVAAQDEYIARLETRFAELTQIVKTWAPGYNEGIIPPPGLPKKPIIVPTPPADADTLPAGRAGGEAL